MRYTKDEDGRINNFAVEPKMYSAEPPNSQEQRNYIILGVVAAALVGGLIAIAAVVS
ncbi:photosystem II assembly protein Psb34 [Altericista sp. CCNU0014]|uniref:photosystem II assembly protein Psb34 n=1 Tax=Altericista sp. CCNU0014 TaxID=3082949 RepID=UPI00384ADA26